MFLRNCYMCACMLSDYSYLVSTVIFLIVFLLSRLLAGIFLVYLLCDYHGFRCKIRACE